MRGSAFFEGIHQLDVEMGGQPGKMPVFYYDGGCMTALFPARYGALRALMPDRRYVPARLAPGLGLLVIGCLEYRDTDIGAYNELLIGVPLNEPYFRANLPGRALVTALRSGHWPTFVWQLPVTTETALRAGVDFYNFPKFIAEIAFSETAEQWRCRLSEGGQHILTFSGERIRASGSGREDELLRLWMDGQPQSAHVRMNRLQVGETMRRTTASLELAEGHPIARELGRLLVSRKPLEYEYCPQFEAILFGPEHLTLSLTQRGLQAVEAVTGVK